MKLILHNLKDPSKVELYSLDGKIIFSNTIELNDEFIFIPFLEKGSYLIRIKTKRSISTSRFYKK